MSFSEISRNPSGMPSREGSISILNIGVGDGNDTSTWGLGSSSLPNGGIDSSLNSKLLDKGTYDRNSFKNGEKYNEKKINSTSPISHTPTISETILITISEKAGKLSNRISGKRLERLEKKDSNEGNFSDAFSDKLSERLLEISEFSDNISENFEKSSSELYINTNSNGNNGSSGSNKISRDSSHSFKKHSPTNGLLEKLSKKELLQVVDNLIGSASDDSSSGNTSGDYFVIICYMCRFVYYIVVHMYI